MAYDVVLRGGTTIDGTGAPPFQADVALIPGALGLRRPRIVADLPAGGRRLLQDATGYRATLVSGRVIAENGRLTGERPGRLVRLGSTAL